MSAWDPANPASTCLLRHDTQDRVHGGGARSEGRARIIGDCSKAFGRLEGECGISAGLLQREEAAPESLGGGVRGREARCQRQRPPEQRHAGIFVFDRLGGSKPELQSLPSLWTVL